MTDRYKETIQGARDCVERNKDGGVYLPDLLRVIDSQQAEIERSKANNKAIMQTIADVHTEAIKEFADKFEGYVPHIEGETTMECVKNAIRQTLKEMVGEQE